MPTLDRILPYTKKILNQCVTRGETVIDATVGNGNDTLFLSELVGADGLVVGFDVQQAAIDATKIQLEQADIKNVKLIHDGHEHILKYVDTTVAAAIFNLGYLPGSDKSVTTTGSTTWQAVIDILSLLKQGGLIILVIYHGHEAGKIERNEIEAAVATLDPAKTEVLRYQFLNKVDAPYVIVIERK